jgi:hypothetical protein
MYHIGPRLSSLSAIVRGPHRDGQLNAAPVSRKSWRGLVRFINNCRVSLAQALASTARTLHGNKRGWCERSGARRGPAPTYRPTFPAEFLAQAPKIVHQRTGRYQLRQRATLVLLCHEPPLVANTEAAACVHRHPHSVRLWRRRWAHGTVVLEDESGRDPQPRFSPSGSRGGPSHRLRGGRRDRQAVASPIAGRFARTCVSDAEPAHQPQHGLAEAPCRCPPTLAR